MSKAHDEFCEHARVADVQMRKSLESNPLPQPLMNKLHCAGEKRDSLFEFTFFVRASRDMDPVPLVVGVVVLDENDKLVSLTITPEAEAMRTRLQ